MNASLATITEWIDGRLYGEPDIEINTLSAIDNILPGSLVFAENRESLKKAEASEAAVILVDTQTTSEKTFIQVSHPFKAFVTLLHRFYPQTAPKAGIHPTAVIADDVIIGQNASIGPYVTIGSGTIIGQNCVIKSHVAIGQQVHMGNNVTLHPHVAIYDHCNIGHDVTVHASTVIGSDGFGYKYVDGQHMKFPHLGHVVIENQVEIGANTAIDRASLGATVIGEGTKIDNLVQVAHSVKLGKQNILCAFTGVAGSSTTGDRVIFAANVGVSDHVHIEDDVILGARTGVPPHRRLERGNTYYGSPARTKEKAAEMELSISRIPMIRRKIMALSEKMDALAQRLAAFENSESS